jgi:hypothetical protein
MDGGGRTLTYVCRTAQENKENEEKEGEEKWQDKGSKSTGEQR